MEPGRRYVYFLSDAHLGARYIADRKEAEARLVAFLREIAPTARVVYLMGDILDFWFEFATVVPRGYVRFFGQLAAMVDSGVRVVWFTGNHDIWLFDYLRDEIGIEVVTRPMVEVIGGKKFYLAHGDGLGPQPLGFRIIRWAFHNRICQKLFAAVHPRWTVGLAYGWSKASRGVPQVKPFGPLDREPLGIFASQYLNEVDPGVNYFVFGHRHAAADVRLSQSCRLVILGDWILQYTYAIFDGNDLKLKQYLR